MGWGEMASDRRQDRWTEGRTEGWTDGLTDEAATIFSPFREHNKLQWNLDGLNPNGSKPCNSSWALSGPYLYTMNHCLAKFLTVLNKKKFAVNNF